MKQSIKNPLCLVLASAFLASVFGPVPALAAEISFNERIEIRSSDSGDGTSVVSQTQELKGYASEGGQAVVKSQIKINGEIVGDLEKILKDGESVDENVVKSFVITDGAVDEERNVVQETLSGGEFSLRNFFISLFEYVFSTFK